MFSLQEAADVKEKPVQAKVTDLGDRLRYTSRIELIFPDRFAGTIRCESYENPSDAAEIYVMISMQS